MKKVFWSVALTIAPGAWGAVITPTVSGVADIYLAGQPSGATLGSDLAPTNTLFSQVVLP